MEKDKQQKQDKAKRKLSNVNFENPQGHIALCTASQGVANKQDFVVTMKAANFSEELIEKIQSVNLTMSLPDFLERFFVLLGEEAEVLAYMMGYREVADTQAHEDMEGDEKYKDWIKSNMESMELLDTLNTSDNYAEVMKSLQEQDYFALLNDQEKLEKAFKKLDEAKEIEKQNELEAKRKPRIKRAKKESEEVTSEGASTNSEVEKKVEGKASVVKTKNKESNMPNVTVVEEVVDTEMVKKAEFDLIQKSLQDMQVELQKARDTVAQFEVEKKAAIEKARKQEMVTAVKDADKAEVLFKAVKDASEEDFQAVIKALAAITATVDNSDLFIEKGLNVEDKPVVAENVLERILKAKYTK